MVKSVWCGWVVVILLLLTFLVTLFNSKLLLSLNGHGRSFHDHCKTMSCGSLF